MSGKAFAAQVKKTYGIKLRAKMGRGTASNWLHVEATPEQLQSIGRQALEKLALDNRLCGQYYTDYGCGVDGYAACFQVTTTR